MLLNQLLQDPHAPAIEIQGLTSDSRITKPGDLFIAFEGATFDGHTFVPDAISRGAIAVCAERPLDDRCTVPWVSVPNIAQHRGKVAARFFRHPVKDMKLVGVTGTNGKTSVCYAAAAMLHTTAFLGTLGWGVPPKLCTSRLTTFDPIEMQRSLAYLRDRSVQRATLEVSSHALHQGRIDELPIGCAVFTNLTRDHLDYHGTMENYGKAKLKLFERPELEQAIVNLDDPFGTEIVQLTRESKVPFLTYGATEQADLRWRSVEHSVEGLNGNWESRWGSTRFSIPYFGESYLANAAAVLLIGMYYGLDFHEAVDRMRELPQIPGRMEFIKERGFPTVVLDYAHTPDALRAALSSLRSHYAQRRLICLFGCGGDRDIGKRPVMAQITEENADAVVVTSDNPRYESPQAIINQILLGFKDKKRIVVEVDRFKAIQIAIEMASEHDIVLVAGKGHESYQEVRGERFPFSDRETIHEALEIKN